MRVTGMCMNLKYSRMNAYVYLLVGGRDGYSFVVTTQNVTFVFLTS